MLLRKGSKLYSIFKNKCPRCQEGDFFESTSFFKVKKLLKLHKHCSHCNLKYMMEPSFYYGAMYVNYGLTVAVSVLTFIISFLVFNLDLLQSFIAIVIVLIFTVLHTVRLSRIIWINLFVKYRKDEVEEQKTSS
ncbi:DUF983 domain-containing protein [Urechidicola vernalis]|uniref:DUF983 domain-containing protein n=1 Tax=Urechidicola vernalis TaxID=3075600 RepID=A0ABU2Y512_9FLAO|nr:DUF983 domain-containing protein [Urechidicola sp. P050]MDT0553281.1 DUF983 domain-containing protein [Urechidicola sp. P050]